MAGLFGLFNFEKEGPGVRKDEPEKKRFFVFLDIYHRHLFDMIKLNLLFLIFCIPIITIGPALAGLFYCTKNYSQEKHVFIFSDFFDAFKNNFKQGLVLGILNSILAYIFYTAITFYFRQSSESWFFMVLSGICVLVVLLYVMMQYYTYLLMITIHIPIRGIIKNSFLMTVISIKKNIKTTLIIAILWFFMYLIGYIGYIFYPTLVFSTLAMVISFNCYSEIEKYVINAAVMGAQDDNQSEEKEIKLIEEKDKANEE